MLELEIQSLLILHGNAGAAARALSDKYRSTSLTLPQLETISTFFLHAGLPASLLDFLCQQIHVSDQLPWGHFVEAMALAEPKIENVIAEAIVQGAEEQRLAWHLARSHVLDNYSESLNQERELRRRSLGEKALHNKRDLLFQIDTLRSQEMENEEGRLLDKALKMFPRDSQIQEQYAEYQTRRALRLLDSKTSQPPEKNLEDLEDEWDAESLQTLKTIEMSMQAVWRENLNDPTMGLDFGVAHMMWDNPEGALAFVGNTESESAIWLRLEALMKARRYIEVLGALLDIETRFAHNPDATLAATYLRARCQWGLKRRFEAVDLLEGLVNIKPNYRDASSLLAVWKRRLR